MRERALDHHFFRRSGELLVEYAIDEPAVNSAAVAGFWIRRAWLYPWAHPKAAEGLDDVVRGLPQ